MYVVQIKCSETALKKTYQKRGGKPVCVRTEVFQNQALVIIKTKL